MDAKLKSDWINALRSGEYRQCRSTLHGFSDSYCCLGVLCKVAEIEMDDADMAYPALEKLTGGYGKLVELNDVEEKSFREIADYIEKEIA